MSLDNRHIKRFVPNRMIDNVVVVAQNVIDFSKYNAKISVDADVPVLIIPKNSIITNLYIDVQTVEGSGGALATKIGIIDTDGSSQDDDFFAAALDVEAAGLTAILDKQMVTDEDLYITFSPAADLDTAVFKVVAEYIISNTALE